MNSPEVSKKGSGSSVSVKLPQQKRFIEIELDYSLASSDQISFAVSVDGISYGGNYWANFFSNFNNYPCSHIPSTKLTIEYMNRHLGTVSALGDILMR